MLLNAFFSAGYNFASNTINQNCDYNQWKSCNPLWKINILKLNADKYPLIVSGNNEVQKILLETRD